MAEEEPLRFCRGCGSERKAKICHKCKIETFVPDRAWEPLQLPDIDQIRDLAKELGYAVGVHGTQERDLDLIAAPWSELALQYNFRQVMDHIAKGMDGRVLSVEKKPLGRWACTIQLDGWFKPIDLSVAPMVTPKKDDGTT